jgi:hypothetical protein
MYRCSYFLAIGPLYSSALDGVPEPFSVPSGFVKLCGGSHN